MKTKTNGKDPNRWYFPPEFSVSMFPLVLAVGTGLISLSLWSIRSGDPTIPLMAMVCAITGVVLLFIARWPLYRQRRFFTFGPRLLDERHRRIYRWSYRFTGIGVLLMSYVLLAMR